MPTNEPTVRVGIFGIDPGEGVPINRHVDLWEVGFTGSLTHAEAVPVELCSPNLGRTWEDILEEIDGVLLCGFPDNRSRSHEEELCHFCREHKLPLLAINSGMLTMNTAFSGTLFYDLPREVPEALQHRQPPEEDVRHLINVIPDTHLCRTYGDGEIIVNSQHRHAVQRLARGFRVSGQALDGIIEAIEWEDEDWFGMGIQWRPASATSSGLDIQIFRTLVQACHKHAERIGAQDDYLVAAA